MTTNPLDHANQPPNDEGLWDVADVATYLKASKSWVYKQAAAGELPCLRVGGLLRFDPATIRAYARGEPVRDARVVSLLGRRRD